MTRSFSGGDIDGDVQNGITISPRGARRLHLFRRQPLLRRRQPAHRRVRRDPAARPEGGPGRGARRGRPGGDDRSRPRGPTDRRAGEVEARGRGPPHRLGSRRRGRQGGRSARPASRASCAPWPRDARARGERRSEVRLVLRPVARYRAELRERERIRGPVWSPTSPRVAAAAERLGAVTFRRNCPRKITPGPQVKRSHQLVTIWRSS